jgi:hypothetical protein
VTQWYHWATDFTIGYELMTGFGDYIWRPYGDLSRAMMAQILYNEAGRPAVSGSSKFPDVADGMWYTDAIIWGTENGVLLGYGNGNIGPDDPITREQFAAMLWRFSGFTKAEQTTLDFYDGDRTSPYAVPALLWATEKGIIIGRGNRRLDPRGNATRAEAAMMLMRYFGAHGYKDAV